MKARLRRQRCSAPWSAPTLRSDGIVLNSGDRTKTREHGPPPAVAADSGAEGVHRPRDCSCARREVHRGDGEREETCGEAASCCTLTAQNGRNSEEAATVIETARCAIYPRFSSEKQNALSIDQQIRKCREYATREGLRVLDECIFTDLAISGAIAARAGLQKLLAAAQTKPRPFDVILVDDTSRLSRDLGDSDRIVKRLKFAGIKVCFVAQGFDSHSESAGMLTAIYGR